MPQSRYIGGMMPHSRRYVRDKSLMHFRTWKWSAGEYSEAREQSIDAASARRHNAIVAELPADLRTLATTDLNDAECKHFARHNATGLVEITLRAGDASKDGYFDLYLRYEQATLLSRHNGLAALVSRSREELVAGVDLRILSRTERRAITLGDTTRAEVRYDEVDFVGDGLFEHRMLLWPYSDLLIRFTGLSPHACQLAHGMPHSNRFYASRTSPSAMTRAYQWPLSLRVRVWVAKSV